MFCSLRLQTTIIGENAIFNLTFLADCDSMCWGTALTPCVLKGGCALLRVIIADDEIHICALIRGLIDWEALGLSFAGQASSGTDACALLFEEKPDIAILDIKMPGMDGLQIIHQAQAAGLKTRFLLVSGHKNFEYAHTALKYGVERYLLKPINRQDLEDNLRQMCEQILSDREDQLALESMADRLRQSAQSNRRHFLYRVFSGAGAPWDGLESINAQYDTRFVPGCFRVAILKPDGRTPYDAAQLDILLTQVKDFCDWALAQWADEAVCLKYQGAVAALVNYHRDQDLDGRIRELFDQARKRFYPYCTLTLALSAQSDRIETGLYVQARCAVFYRLALGPGRIIEYGKHHFTPLSLCSPADQRAFINTFDALSPTPVEDWLQKNQGVILDDGTDPYCVYRDLRWLMNNLVDERLLGACDQEELEALKKKHEFLLDNAGTRQGLLDAFHQAFAESLGKYIASQKRAGSKYIQQAKQYVQAHYAENVILEDIASTIFINPVYLSILFKKEEGKNFSEYLMEYRIERAKELIKDGSYSMHQISRMVGYQDARYFSKVFTRIAGIKPSDYRRLY